MNDETGAKLHRDAVSSPPMSGRSPPPSGEGAIMK